MKDDIITGILDFYETNILARIMQMWEHPIDLVLFLIDIAIVIFLAYRKDLSCAIWGELSKSRPKTFIILLF